MNAFTKQCIQTTTTVLILGRAHHWPVALTSQLNTDLITRVINLPILNAFTFKSQVKDIWWKTFYNTSIVYCEPNNQTIQFYTMVSRT